MRKPIFLTKCGRFVAAMMALMCAVGFNASAASADVLHAGYCDGQANSEGTIVFDDATQVSACMLLDDSTMSRFAGNQVVAIDYYLISKLSISSLTLWVRATPDGENLVEKTLTKSALVKGWNSTTLDNPLDIDGKARYVGYTYTQSRAAYVVATAEGSHVGGLMLKADDGVWSETTGSGVLALECQVKGNNLPQYDGRIDDMSVMSTRIKLGQPLAINGVVTNVAAQPFSSINVTCTSAGMTPMTFEVPLDKTVSYRESCNFGFSFTPNYNAAASDINLTVTINTEDDNADQYKDNSTRSLLYSTYDHDFTKRMVIEEFTSEKCVYCPNAAARLAQALQERGDRAVAICHHSGFSSDDFTVDGIDWDIASAFSLGGNPQFLYDRTSFDGTYLFNPSDYQEFVDAIDYVTATDADIEVNVFASVDKQAHTITAMVKGDVGSNFTDNAPNITLYLLENEVPAVAQKNQYGEVIDGFLHEHIIRAYNDSTWGGAHRHQQRQLHLHLHLHLRPRQVGL